MAEQTWNSLKQTLLIALSQATAPYTIVPADFTNLMPQATSYAENRIYRDIPMLAQQGFAAATPVPGASTVSIAALQPPVVVVEQFGFFAGPGVSGRTYWFEKTTLEVVSNIWPDRSLMMDPVDAEWTGRYWAMLNNSIIIFAPPPISPLTANLVVLSQPTPISDLIQTTNLSIIYPDLLQMACLVFMSGALKNNFGQLAVTPQEAVTWETQYQALMESAKQEEMRRRGLLPAVPLPSRPAAPAGVPAR